VEQQVSIMTIRCCHSALTCSAAPSLEGQHQIVNIWAQEVLLQWDVVLWSFSGIDINGALFGWRLCCSMYEEMVAAGRSPVLGR
jgi:hypothetical protein